MNEKWNELLLELNKLTQLDNNNIGINNFHNGYIEINKNQDINTEYRNIQLFLAKFLDYYSEKHNIEYEKLKLQFINYGKTELVYVLTEPNGNMYTVLVKQPIVPFGKVYEEKTNLRSLNTHDKNVIKPIGYFAHNNQELFITPYIHQARCIASYENTWGMYIPEPYYRFVPFSKKQEQIVTTCMIAKLISLYDSINNKALISCKLGSGDFILPKGWENKTTTIENTLNNMYLIAARERILCSFNNYQSIIRNEFSRQTINENENDLIINLRGRTPIKQENIEAGIELGKQLLKENKHKIY